MGYSRHDAVIVQISGYAMNGKNIGWRDVPDVDLDGFRSSLPEDWQRLVIGPIHSIVNDYWTVVFLPDGSKEGWGVSNDGDEYRRRFVELFSFAYDDDSSPYDIAHVRFGGDEPGARYEPELIADNGRGLRIESVIDSDKTGA